MAGLMSVAACNGSPPASTVIPAPSAPPAADLLAGVSIPTDFHLTYQKHFLAEESLAQNVGYVTKLLSGQGDVVLKPSVMASLHETDTFCADLCSSDEIVNNNDRYTRNDQSSWNVDHGVDLNTYDWTAILPSTLRQADAISVAGTERIDGALTWVVDARTPNGQAFRVWLRQDNDYPVQLTSSPHSKTPYLDITIKLTDFDRERKISIPTRNQLNPLYWGTQIHLEQPIPIEGGSVIVHPSVYNCHGGADLYDSETAGYFVLIPLTYVAGTKPLAIDPRSWAVYDAVGIPFPAEPAGTLIAQTVPPGQSRSGDLCFLLPWNHNGFALVGHLPGGIVTSFVGNVRLPDATGTASPEGT